MEVAGKWPEIKISGHLLRSPSPTPVNSITNPNPATFYFLSPPLTVYYSIFMITAVPPSSAPFRPPPAGHLLFRPPPTSTKLKFFYINRLPILRSITCPSRFVQKPSPGPPPATRRFPARASPLPPSLPSSPIISSINLPPPSPSPPLRSVLTAACHRRRRQTLTLTQPSPQLHPQLNT